MQLLLRLAIQRCVYTVMLESSCGHHGNHPQEKMLCLPQCSMHRVKTGLLPSPATCICVCTLPLLLRINEEPGLNTNTQSMVLYVYWSWKRCYYSMRLSSCLGRTPLRLSLYQHGVGVRETLCDLIIRLNQAFQILLLSANKIKKNTHDLNN